MKRCMMDIGSLVTESTLKHFEHDRQLGILQERLAASPTLNVFALLERFNRLKRSDEYLHSKMIEFLLNPSNTQPLGDAFLRELLGMAGFYKDGKPVSGPRRSANITATASKREAPAGDGRIDVWLRSEKHNFIVIIENKTLSPESPNQLKGYWEGVQKDNPEASLAGFFLTPDGRPPRTAGGHDFVALSYEDLVVLLDKALKKFTPTSSLDAVTQYVDAIRRWFVSEPILKDLAWGIGQKNLAAIDFVSANTPHRQIGATIEELIIRASLKCFNRFRAIRRFDLVIDEWEKVPELRRGGLYKPIKSRLLYIVIENPRFEGDDPTWPKELYIELLMVAGKNRQVRNALYKAIKDLHFAVAPDDFSDGSLTLWKYELASEKQLKTLPRDKLLRQIEARSERFIEKDLPCIQKAIRSIHFELANEHENGKLVAAPAQNLLIHVR
jgi:hypothetical protein